MQDRHDLLCGSDQAVWRDRSRARGLQRRPERAARWLADRRGFDQDEFIDDIPFPETQNYVKRIIGTAEDYRTLVPAGDDR